MIGLLCALAGLAGAHAALAQATPPNIVYIIADDMGWADAGFQSSDISTPNLDGLARRRVRQLRG